MDANKLAALRSIGFAVPLTCDMLDDARVERIGGDWREFVEW